MRYPAIGNRIRAFRRGRRRRLGATITEFAIIAPIFFLFVLSSFEFGRAIMVQQILTNAAREGARQAIVENAVAADVVTSVTSYLSSTTVDGVTVTVDPTSLQTVGFGDEVTVTVTVPYDQVSWLPVSSFVSGKILTGESMMRGERLQ
ncbi:MAG: pilus assembly protein [Planctomycetes bacterium]|nr:pilus assembly protein [Planctomycetota bacterium]